MQKQKRKVILLSAAGTGGHLFPAQELAKELADEYEILFAGKNLSKNPYFSQGAHAFVEVNAATFSLKKPHTLVRASYAIARGVLQSVGLIAKKKPSLLIGFGSFFSLPLLLAAKIKRVPIILHEQNLFPGRVNRLFAPHSLFLASSFPTTHKYVKGRVEEVLFPKREGCSSKKVAATYFGLSESKRTLLIFGGSQGACFINKLAKELAPHLTEFQLLHFVGKGADPKEFSSYYNKVGVEAVVKSFEEEMQRAYTMADLALARAGAGTVHELIEASCPAILLPFPFATDDHQTKNGQFFADRVGGGFCLSQIKATKERVLEIILSCNEELLLAKKRKMQEYVKQKNAKLDSLATLVRRCVT